jgi:hypothetical protein
MRTWFVIALLGACSSQPKPTPVTPGGSDAPPVGNQITGDQLGPVDAQYRLQATEGRLVVEAPGEAAPNAQVAAKVKVTVAEGYELTTNYPLKLSLEAPPGVTLEKAVLTSGGMERVLGDAEMLDKSGIAFIVKASAAAPGSFTIHGVLKFSVCDHEACIAKKEPIEIALLVK